MIYRKAFILFLFLFSLIRPYLFGQDQMIADSLARIYKADTVKGRAKFELLVNLSFNEITDSKKSIQYAEELISLSQKADNDTFLQNGYYLKGNKKRRLGQLDEALTAFFKSAEIARKTHLLKREAESYNAIGDTYASAQNHTIARNYYNLAIKTFRQSKLHYKDDSINLASIISNTGEEFRKAGSYDSALLYFREAYEIFDKTNYPSGKGYALGNTGLVYAGMGKNELAERNINEAISILEKNQDYSPICEFLTVMADVYFSRGDKNTAIGYALKSLHLAEQYGLKEQAASASLKLSELYEKTGNKDGALMYYKKHIAYRDSINNINMVQKMADLRTNYEVSQKQLEVNLLNQQKKDGRKLSLALGIILGLTIMILLLLLNYNQNRQKAYKILNQQKQETEDQKAKAENALSELQRTQKQLVQSAKMASLGELTAGIAHEIQNPLNFVNNFSEVSIELLDELREDAGLRSTDPGKTDIDHIINDLAENLRKINVHGNRAGSIVKGMLQHSRTGTGMKEQVNINALADEYLRLSYHGLRAKDKTFNANVTTAFDKNINTIEAVPQDIGRVLLNLYNNAFYSVNEKKKVLRNAYDPIVSVSTKKVGNKIELSIKDNGNGIPKKILDKIFQPFFTTKPAGEGTGLGLSLSYEIINAHDGQLIVESKEGEGAEFVIKLPA